MMTRSLRAACSLACAIGIGLLAAGQGVYWVSAVGLGLVFLGASLVILYEGERA